MKAGFITTTLRAAYLHARNEPKTAFWRFWGAFRHIIRFRRSGAAQARARLRACEICPIYDKRWEACGNGVKKLKNGEFVGCLCHMPTKARIPTATCWIRDYGIDDGDGWPT